MSVLSIYAVFANAEEAERIARTVVDERLAACANILGPMRSIYRWKGKIETADEVAAIFKTHHWRADALIARIAELHSYDVPGDRQLADRQDPGILRRLGRGLSHPRPLALSSP